ncbi:short chain dehydrogenase [Kangiella sp. TOML190]|uniref:short chain dehydrogenase n=1 Tax=Kangiella sp. TOML190 TaxID=2931351 RepID=UPI0020412846|nr:short chain dehydrogenase [Kangiella sp. TOML190]
MKIIVVGATGVLGQAVAASLRADHEIIEVGLSNGAVNVDITELESIHNMYEKIGPFDSLISTTGVVHFGPLEEMTQEQWQLGLNNKLMGQINLVTEGLKYIRDNGSFTLTSGIISKDPIRFGSAAALVNRALEGFVTCAALEMPRGVRINAVSPTILEESAETFGPYFMGFDPIPASTAALGFVKSVEGLRNGEIFEIRGAI